jgi:RNA polymerase sigma-70 factor (ECF subfamily)
LPLSHAEAGTLTSLADTELLRSVAAQAAAGDPVALERLLLAVSPGVARVCRTVLGGSAPELDDAIQESLLALVRALGSFRGESSLRHFAHRIAVRTALSLRRRTRRRTEVSSQLSLEPAYASEGADPFGQCTTARRQALLRSLLDALPSAQAETLALRVVLGASLEETAAATQVPVNTVRSRLRLARESLRARIEAEPALLDLLGGEP